MCCASVSGSRSSSSASRRASSSEIPSARSSLYRSSRCCDSSSMISASRPGLRCNSARRGRRWSTHSPLDSVGGDPAFIDESGMVDSGDEAHRVHERLPGMALPRQHTAALGGEAVEAPPPLAGLLDPLPLQPAPLLEAIQERIERRDVELQMTARPGLDELADLVAVAGARLHDRENHQLRRPLFQLAIEHAPVYSCHNHICYSQ